MNEEGADIGNHCYWPPAVYVQLLLAITGDNSGDGHSETLQYTYSAISKYYFDLYTFNDIRYL